MEYSSNGKGNLGVTLGAIGTGLSALSGTGLLSGFTNGNNANHFITREEAKLMPDLASKDSEIALLKAESDSENKMTEVYDHINN